MDLEIGPVFDFHHLSIIFGHKNVCNNTNNTQSPDDILRFQTIIIGYQREIQKLINTSKIEQLHIVVSKLYSYLSSLESIPFSNKIIELNFANTLIALFDQYKALRSLVSCIFTSLASNKDYIDRFIESFDPLNYIYYENGPEIITINALVYATKMIQFNLIYMIEKSDFFQLLLGYCMNITNLQNVNIVYLFIYNCCIKISSIKFLDEYVNIFINIITYIFNTFENYNDLCICSLIFLVLNQKCKFDDFSTHLVQHIKAMEIKSPYYGLWLISFLIQSDEKFLQIFAEDNFVIDQIFNAHIDEPLVTKDCRCSIIFYFGTILSQNHQIQDINMYAQFIITQYGNMNIQFKIVSIYFVTTILSMCQFSQLQDLDFDQLFEILSDILILQNYLKFKYSDFQVIIERIKANTAGWTVNINDLLERNDIISQLEIISDDDQ